MNQKRKTTITPLEVVPFKTLFAKAPDPGLPIYRVPTEEEAPELPAVWAVQQHQNENDPWIEFGLETEGAILAKIVELGIDRDLFPNHGNGANLLLRRNNHLPNNNSSKTVLPNDAGVDAQHSNNPWG